MPAPIKNIDFDEILDPNQCDDTNPLKMMGLD